MPRTPKLPATERVSVKNGARPQYDDDGRIRMDKATCGTCRRVWNDALISDRTPAPAGRCPYEAWHS